MKIIKYKGGLGNQMFQYAFACMLKEKYHQGRILADFSAYDSEDKSGIRVPRILQLNTDITIANEHSLNEVKMFHHRVKSKPLYKMCLGLEGVLNKRYYLEWNRAYICPERLLSYQYYDGYWQSWRYLKGLENTLYEAFTLRKIPGEKTQNAIKKFSAINSVMLGIRRGDYLKDQKHFGIFDAEYYYHCMDYIQQKIENPVFIIFSNDIEWVKKNMDFRKYSVKYRLKNEQDSDTEELMVMASCKHFIIVNSTYQWWGAWLSKKPEKIVIAPEKWFSDDKPIDIVPPGWIKM